MWAVPIGTAVPAASADGRAGHAEGIGPQLGWDTWLRSQPPEHDAENAIIAGETISRLPETQETLGSTSPRC